jgi:hypothetical protein
MQQGSEQRAYSWTIWASLALGLSLVHVLIDFSIGQYGDTSSSMSLLQSANIFLFGLIYASWPAAMGWAGGGNRTGAVCLLLLVVAWSFLTNGLGALAACPPGCDDAYPYQDVAHIGNAVIGGIAGNTLWRKIRAEPGRVSWGFALCVAAALVAAWAVQAAQGSP